MPRMTGWWGAKALRVEFLILVVLVLIVERGNWDAAAWLTPKVVVCNSQVRDAGQESQDDNAFGGKAKVH